jgi:ORF6N domain
MAIARKRPGKAVAVTRPVETLVRVIRGQKVILDSDLAELYEVSTKRLNEAVRRNSDRFPEDFAFLLTNQEVAVLRSQIATSSFRHGGPRYIPRAFTEHGIAMLSSVLRSERAVQMNIKIVRAFVRMRELIASHKDLSMRIEKLERSHDRTASVIEVLVEDIDRLAHEVKEMKALPPVTKRKIGFYTGED